MSKEARNPQFDFLKPAHGLFNYFTKLVEQYTKILIPSKESLNKITQDIDNQFKVLDEVYYRSEWVKHQLRERANEEAALEKERGMILLSISWNLFYSPLLTSAIKLLFFFVNRLIAAYSQIDWHDFVVVEIVDYQPQEQGNFPVFICFPFNNVKM